MKTLAALLLAAALAGCATAPLHHVAPNHVAPKAHAVNKPAEIEAPTTPNKIVKHRWYDRFLRHKPSK